MILNFARALLLVCLFLDVHFASAQSDTPSINDVIASFDNYDLDEDGVPEIKSLRVVHGLNQSELAVSDKLLIVLVETRLLELDAAASEKSLLAVLQEYGTALASDDWKPVFIDADLYAGDRHQDGQTVLALRRFFQSVKQSYANFAGAVLVGSFPESMLVRRWVWKRDDRTATFNGVTYNDDKGPEATFLAMDPELISPRSDVVLCDLDGLWEELYQQPKIEIDSIRVLPDEVITSQRSWPLYDQIITTDKFSIRKKSFEDCFFIDDCRIEILELTDQQISMRCDYEMRIPEVGPEDRETPNPLARPDIMVSRINPRHVAVVQPKSNLDAAGKPKAVPAATGSPNRQFTRSETLELQLLVEYFHRNLDHRRGMDSMASQRVASLWTDLQTPSKKYFASVTEELGKISTFPRANAVDFVRFMKTPAIIKGVSAHSNSTCSMLLRGYKPEELAQETGGSYWYWKKHAEEYVPSYDHSSIRDLAHFSLLRTLWENNQLPAHSGSFYIHGGCEAISPVGAAKHPYNSLDYGGQNQIAESLLFYGNGLALIGRAKVFYDIPRGFDDAFGTNHGRFGDILTEYFHVESQDARLASSVASRNRTYFWSIIGDWTLRLKYDQNTIH